MKKFTLTLTIVGIALIPTLLLAQPPRPHAYPPVAQPPRPQAYPQFAQPAQVARPTMQVHVPTPPPPMHNQRVVVNRPPVGAHPAPYYQPHFQPPHHPPVVQPRVVVVPQVVAPPVIAAPVIAPPVVVPGYYDYYAPVSNGFSLTIGGRNGVFNISTAR